MTSILNRCTAALLASFAAAASCSAHVGPLDLPFGDGGMRNYGFSAVNGSGRSDTAIVACPSVNNTLTVAGLASDQRRIVTLRILPNGNYDENFSGDGRESFDITPTDGGLSAGLCQPDGNLVIARSIAVDASGEQNIQILRINANTGQLDPSFGTGGVVILDMDQWQSGLAKWEVPLALNMLDNGEILLSGLVLASGQVAMVARITATGTVDAAKVYFAVPGRPTAVSTASAMLAPDGKIWSVMDGSYPGSVRITPYRVVLNRSTLAWEQTPDAAPSSSGSSIFSGAGRRVRDGVMAVPVMDQNTAKPALMIYRASGKNYVALPPASIDGQPAGIAGSYGHLGVTVLPDGRVLYGASTVRDNLSVTEGLHFAMVRVGANAAEDKIDTVFGQGGAQSGRFIPFGANCSEVSATQQYARMTLWMGKPVMVGMADMSCSTDKVGRDYLVVRLAVAPSAATLSPDGTLE